MDHNKWTPIKNDINCDNILMLSPITRTPVRKNDMKLRTSFQNSTGNFSLLPNHRTPPSGLTKFIARNPFEADLTNKLHISVISPSVFSKVTSPAQRGSPSFSWSIDELALIQPAKIDEFPVQQMHCSDPEIEKNAQEAISRFFSENQIIPSPYDARRIDSKVLDLKTPVRVSEDINTSRESQKSRIEKRENWTQTALSLPPQLPPHVEEALKPYFNFTQDQNCDYEEVNTSNTSLRRKLFTNHDDSHDDSSCSISLSPVEPRSPVHHNLSPAQSGMFFHGTPLKNCSQIVQRTFGTPLAYSLNSSPCNVSPINNPGLSMSCQSIKSRNRSVARLDFTKDMSVDMAMDDDKKCDTYSEAKELCKTLFTEEIIADAESDISHYYTDDEKYCDATQMVISTESSMKLVSDNKDNIALNNFNIINKSKMTEICKTKFSESFAMQQSNMLSGNYAQQMAFISAQDTGYQTHSSSNLTSNMDSYSNSIKQKLQWDERIAQADDEVRLSDWSDSMKNMISSTPSKFNSGINIL